MNRFAPLIVRHSPAPRAIPAAIPMPAESTLVDDLRFFAMAWVAGFIFFGTLFA